MKISVLDELINESENIVCISGRNMASDCGYQEYWSDEFFYYVEDKYGCSPEEIFNLGCFEIRRDRFYKFYKEEVLKESHRPSAAYYSLAKLEKMGKLKCIITKDMHNLAQRAGCKNVIDIYGNIVDNVCPKCGQKYSIDYIKHSKGIPTCLECGSVIRPGVVLTGEMVDNEKVTKAMEAIAHADMLLILDLDDEDIFSKYIEHYKGNKMVLIKSERKDSDYNADYIIYDKSKNVLSKLGDNKVHVMFDELVVVNN